jgi:hypothetical protein
MGGYNKYRWWTRGRKVKPLPERTPLLLKIINGDFEYSYMFDESKSVRDDAKLVYEYSYNNYIGSTESGRIEAAMNSSRMKRLKAIKLEMEAGLDEERILTKLRKELENEFGKDLWEDVINDPEFDGTVFDMYYRYKSILGMETTPSEFDIRYKRNNCSNYLYLLERVNEKPEKKNAQIEFGSDMG